MAKLKITLSRSIIKSNEKQKATAKALGLTKTGKTVEQKDNPQIRGMINIISHLVKVEEI